ncbi:class I SAM-dependent methyltransferase [Cellulosimicrobium arenosum]|uniref:Class I SAM-dependent methyltransferase n=1 Tax=Cellulosimicrobium arenosum TaxID=2708133 RepID=A0A927J0Q6_9MICO|nr:class I SAM-dependent methyltransferase [Cellulosimicrobium arenosum]MBD8079692.1 class I SAM-dependent methyltransferase [Cellulosimicrobium arenosum]
MTADEQSTPVPERLPPPVDAFATRLFDAALGAFDVLAVHVGDRLGWYRALADGGPLTSTALAEATGTHERYAREWLEQQAATGILVAQDSGAAPALDADPQDVARERLYALPAAHAEVLTDASSLAYTAPLARMIAAVGPQLPHLLDAYRTGGGVSWDQLGDDARQAQADINRPWFEHELGPTLRRLPAAESALSRPGARALDVGCGFGWSTLAIARAFPDAVVQGVDLDGPSVEAARAAAAAAGLADRVTFHHGDASELDATDPFDAAFAFECVHDMPRPVAVLDAVRRSVRPRGLVVVMDEAVGEEFTAPADDVDRVMYGYSLFVCLPDGLSSQPSVGTGTVLRPATLRRYALDAGFSGLEVLPVEDFSFFRFYRLVL